MYPISLTPSILPAKSRESFPLATGAAGILIGTAAALFYARQGLTLSHYDAKAHLVVARRVLDSLTPEYSQIGAVWLPLPHLLNLLPVQIDAFYRTGFSAVAISVLAFGLACYAIARLVGRVTGSRLCVCLSVALFAFDPDVLYLQSTPMTEPLLFALTLLSVALAYDWVTAEGADRPVDAAKLRAQTGWSLVAACLTRYEAWFVMAALLALSVCVFLRFGFPFSRALRTVGRLALYPFCAIVAFLCHSRFTIGEWFVTGGFFVPDNPAHGHPLSAFLQVTYGTRLLAGNSFAVMAVIGIGVILVAGIANRDRAPWLVILSLAAFLALPSYAFFEGHPFRMRYMIAPVVSVPVFIGIAVATLPGVFRAVAAVALAVWIGATLHPLDAKAPMVQEAQWDHPASLGRHIVTECLMREYHHEPILASMGSLAHYMQELSNQGLGIRDFVHEGNMPYWQKALQSPKGRVTWILIEEDAEGGDQLAMRARASPQFLTGFRRMCSGGGVALYKAVPEP